MAILYEQVFDNYELLYKKSLLYLDMGTMLSDQQIGTLYDKQLEIEHEQFVRRLDGKSAEPERPGSPFSDLDARYLFVKRVLQQKQIVQCSKCENKLHCLIAGPKALFFNAMGSYRCKTQDKTKSQLSDRCVVSLAIGFKHDSGSAEQYYIQQYSGEVP